MVTHNYTAEVVTGNRSKYEKMDLYSVISEVCHIQRVFPMKRVMIGLWQ